MNSTPSGIRCIRSRTRCTWSGMNSTRSGIHCIGSRTHCTRSGIDSCQTRSLCTPSGTRSTPAAIHSTWSGTHCTGTAIHCLRRGLRCHVPANEQCRVPIRWLRAHPVRLRLVSARFRAIRDHERRSPSMCIELDRVGLRQDRDARSEPRGEQNRSAANSRGVGGI